MIENVYPIEELRSPARAKARPYDTKTVAPELVADETSRGWQVAKAGRRRVRLKRPKQHGQLLEDRVWSLFYRLRFRHISGESGASLPVDSRFPDGPRSQIDVVAIDDEVAIAVECKSSERPARRPSFQEELAKHAVIREGFANAVAVAYPSHAKTKVVLAMFLSNAVLSENDRERAKRHKVVLFDVDDLKYYESLASHIGPAAKYQLLADMLPGESVPGLLIRVPAMRSKIGDFTCYTFSLSPEYLLKISYVSHRSKGKASDVPTYQRMLNKTRLDKIKKYISNDGIFPTNIVVNLDHRYLRFERIRQEQRGTHYRSGALLGWLEIRPAYKSAWIIDGQHRLYAYSGHDRAPTSRLVVLAFEGLAPSQQASLFVDINGKQKAVKQSLLQELYGELHWEAGEPSLKLRAIISRAVQYLDSDRGSPFFQRIQMADSPRSALRCITLTSLFGAIEKTGFHIVKTRGSDVVQYGPLWAGTNDATLRRTVTVLNHWFSHLRSAAQDWWDKGSDPGGGLAMSDTVVACVNVLRSVLAGLDSKGVKLSGLDDEDLCEATRPFAVALGQYLASLNEAERKRFRDLRGIQGQTTRTHRCQQAIRRSIPDFRPPGLDEFIEQERAQTNAKAKEVIDTIERNIQKLVLEELRREFGPEESQWWILGVPKRVRVEVAERYEEDAGRRGGKESYFHLIDYRDIALQNWNLFEGLLALEPSGNKQKRTQWMVIVNDKRNIVSHPSSGVSLSTEELSELETYDEWLRGQLLGIS